MSRGISSSLDFLIDMIQSILPKTDVYHNFVYIKSDGQIDNLEDLGNQTRYFDLRFDTYSQDDGMAGLSGRKRSKLTLKVRYDIGRDKAYTDRMIAEDSSYLINKLMGPDYSFNTTGIVSLVLQNSTIESITNREGVLLAYILNLPFDLIFMED